jgi:signal transduction histidine kinase/CheY-like chemotaxis protein
VLFLRTLLHTSEKFPRIDRLLLTLVVAEWIMAPGVLFGDMAVWANLSFPLHFPITVVMVAAGLYAASRGIKAAQYYVVGYAFLALGSLLNLLALNGIAVPPEWGSYGLPAGMLLNNLLLMLAAIEHVMEVRKDKEEAQAALLQAQATHQAELEKTVAQRTADLNSALVDTRKTNESQAKLLSYISHDLRAPLSSIVEFSSRLSHHQDPEVQRYRATIECSALYQLELIDDLIEYTRGKLDRLQHFPVPTRLKEWLDQVAQQAELLASQQRNRFVMETQNLPTVAQIDVDRLRQVLINLLVNASKFTTNGAIRLRVQSSPVDPDNIRLTFTVDDTGAGISKYDMARIFQPFGKKSPAQGSGLGLAIASQLVSTMGGELKVESVPGVGSTFCFSLVVETGSDEAVAEGARTLHFSQAFGAGQALLLADGNRASRSYVRDVLTTAAFDVTCVEDGEEALRLALEKPFAAVIVDQFMPGLDGWEFLRKLRAAHPGNQPPIILCSSLPSQKPEEFPGDLDFNVTLVKPVPAEALLRILAIHLKTRRPSPVTSTR